MAWLDAALGAWLLVSHPADAEDPLAALERRQQEIFNEVAPSVVHIATPDGIGSGFIVSTNGLVLTNAHVVGEHQEVNVTFHDGKRVRGKILERVEDVDLALVAVPVRRTRPLELASVRDLRVGAWVGAVGHGMGGIWSYNTGMVSNIYPVGDDRSLFQTQIPLNPGNSGGPLIDREGRVVGVATAKIADAEGINFGVKIDVAPNYLPRMRMHCSCLTVKAPAGVPIFIDDEMVGEGPAAVIIAEPRRYEIFAVIGGKREQTAVLFPLVRETTLGSSGGTSGRGHPTD